MTRLAPIPLVLFFVLTGATREQPRGWRDIIPLHSTRADVERLLGPPPPPPEDGSMLYTPNPDIPLYFLEDEEVRIGYMTDSRAERRGCSAVPIDTVLWVAVTAKKPFPLAALGIDENRFETFDPSTPSGIGFKAYVDVIDGMYICTAGGEVRDYGYYGDATDRQVCPALNQDPKQFCQILVDFGHPPKKPAKPKSN
ncbi:MAG TPA: hypothetical protein VKJ45_05265 [Blastocatellia bacterium]|nr:hypothetical protein [Blastocatellia bacterium]